MPEITNAPKGKGEPDGLREKFNIDLKRSIAYMDPIHQRMDRDYEWYRNNRNVQDMDSPMTISQLYEYVETVTPIVTNNRIRANVYSEYPEYVTHAKGINDILDHTYDVNNWDYTSQELMRQSLIQRSAIAYSGYDKDYKNGTGKLCIDQCNIRWSYLDPGALCLEDSGYFFYVEPKRKSEVIALHPDKKDEIKKANFGLTSDNGDKKNSWFKTFLKAVKQRIVFTENNTKERRSYFDSVIAELEDDQRYANSIAYIHYWYRDDDDKWKISHWADTLFLDDEDNPFWHEKLPYDIFSPIKDTRSLLGVPIGEQIGGVDKQRNDIFQYIVANARLHANPQLLYNTTIGNIKDPRKLKQEADEGVMMLNNPDFVPMRSIADYMQPPQMDANAIQMPERLENTMDKITGVNDSFRGTQQATSGKEVQLQQEASYTRIKTMIDQFELFNKNIAEKVIVNAMQFYTQTRGFRVKGDYTRYAADQQIMEQEGQEMPFDIKPITKGIDGEGQPIMSRTEFFLYANPNEWTQIQGSDEIDDDESNETEKENESPEQEEVEKAYKILSFTVEIEAGSSLPQSRLARREEAMQLYSAHAIDQESLLQSFDWPDREEIIKRMGEQAQQAQQAQAQAAQADAQAKVQAEQVKAQTDVQLKQMEIEGNLAKQHISNRGKVAEQSVQNSGNSLASMLDKIRQAVPEAANMSDDQLLQAVGGVQQ